MTIDSRERRKVERVLALGHVEAKRRRFLVAQLDALTEACAAACDVLIPDFPEPQPFHLSHVTVAHGAQRVSSTLAEFDLDDIAGHLGSLREVWIAGHWVVRVPALVPTDADEILADAYRDIIGKSEFTAAPSADSDDSESIPREITREFHASLRHAFDILVEGAPENTFTLRVERIRDSYLLSRNGHRASHILGYCLPSSRIAELHELLASIKDPELDRLTRQSDPLTRIALLETPLRPADPDAPFRSQSHTNVVTRTASLVRRQGERTRLLEPPHAFKGPDDTHIPRSIMEKLERAAWGMTPDAVFLMPITNHEFVEHEAQMQTIAHWYTVADGLDIESLLARRISASRLLSEVLYQRYCSAVARELAIGIANGDTPEALTQRCASVGRAYGMPSRIEVGALDGESTGSSLRSDLESLQALRIVEYKYAWHEGWSLRMSGLSLVASGPRSKTTKLEVLLNLALALEQETARQERVVQPDELISKLDMIHKSASDILQIHNELKQRLEKGQAAPFDRLRNMISLFGHTTTLCHQHSPILIRVGNWRFHNAHDLCERPDCNICTNEHLRRAAYLFGASPDESSPDAPSTWGWTGTERDAKDNYNEFIAFCSRTRRRPSHWIKKGAESTRDSPSLAALVSLLYLCGARVGEITNDGETVDITDAAEARYYSGLRFEVDYPGQWMFGLAGVAKVSRLEDTAGNDKDSVPVAIDIAPKSLCWRLSHPRYREFMGDVYKRFRNRDFGTSAPRDLRQCSMEGKANVSWDHNTSTLTVTWAVQTQPG